MTIKIKRAMRLAVIGTCPASAEAMLDMIPADIQASLTARQIAGMMDALWRACGASKAIAAQDAIAEGGIWDAARGVMREIAPARHAA